MPESGGNTSVKLTQTYQKWEPGPQILVHTRCRGVIKKIGGCVTMLLRLIAGAGMDANASTRAHLGGCTNVLRSGYCAPLPDPNATNPQEVCKQRISPLVGPKQQP